MQKLEINPLLKEILLKTYSNTGNDIEHPISPEPPQRKRRCSFPFIYVSSPQVELNSGGDNVFVSAGSYSWSPGELKEFKDKDAPN